MENNLREELMDIWNTVGSSDCFVDFIERVEKNGLKYKSKLIVDLTERNNDLIKENKEAWDIVQEYRSDVWSGEHLSINSLNAEIEKLKETNEVLVKQRHKLADENISYKEQISEIKRRYEIILSEANGIVRETMINNLFIDLPNCA